MSLGYGGSFYASRNPEAGFYWAGLWSSALPTVIISAASTSPNAIWQMFAPQPAAYYRAAIVAFPRNPLVIRQPRQPVRPQLPIRSKSHGGNPTVRPGSPAISLARPPAATVRAILRQTQYAPLLKFLPRYFPVPYRPRPRGGNPIWLRQTVPGIAPTVPPIALNLNAWACLLLSSDSDPLAVNPGGAVVVSSDGDPLAVDAGGAVVVSSDGDPLAVDPSQSFA